MIIRSATMTDALGMGRVMVDTWLAAHRGQVPDGQWQRRREDWSYADSERSWRSLLAEIADGSNTEDCVYVAVRDEGEVIGVAVGCPAELDLLPNAAEVSALYVHPTAQGQGLGRRLVRAVAAHQANLGRQAFMISVLTTNAPARRFYEAIGGQLIGAHETEDYVFPEPQVVYGWEDIATLAS